MKLVTCLWLCAVASASSATQPAVVELVGDDSKLIFDKAYVNAYRDAGASAAMGLHVDSTRSHDNVAVVQGKTKVDNILVVEKFADLETQLDDLENGRVTEHTGNLTLHFHDALSDAEQRLDARITQLDTLHGLLDARSVSLDALNATQQSILQRLALQEQTVHNLGTTTTPPPTTTTSTTPAPAYGTREDVPGHSCWDILGHNGGNAASGPYWIRPVFNQHPPSTKVIRVWCDMERDGGGWALVQKGGTQGCFITSVNNVESPQQTEPAKLSDALINQLVGGHAGVSRWLHGSPNWKDYDSQARNAAPAATKIFFRGKIESTSAIKHRPFFCGSTPSGTTSTTYSDNPNALKHWEPLNGYSSHFGFDTYQGFDANNALHESMKRNCGVVEHEHLLVDGVDNRHCAGNHICKNPRNYAGDRYKGLPDGYKGMGSYFIGCLGDYNELPAETSNCTLGGDERCLAPNMDSAVCGARAQMKNGYCNGINWDSHSHGGCNGTAGFADIDGGCHQCTFMNETSGMFEPGCLTDPNPLTKFEWPELRTENMTMWVRPEIPEAKQFGKPLKDGVQLCFNMADPAANKLTADAFCASQGQGFKRSQAAETHLADDAADETCKQYTANNNWELKEGEGQSGSLTKGNRIVRIECIKQEYT